MKNKLEPESLSKQLKAQPAHVYMYTCTHVHMHTCTHAHMYIYTHVHMYTCTHVHMHTCTHAHMHTCTHVPIHTCTHPHMCTCTHPQLPKNLNTDLERTRIGPLAHFKVVYHEEEGLVILPAVRTSVKVMVCCLLMNNS